MGTFRLPGPLCRFLGALEIDTGTMCRQTSPAPGPLPVSPSNQARNATGKAFAATSVTRANESDPNQAMVASDNAASFIASFEAMGFICPDGKVRAYQDGGCAKGNWTIGIGEMSGRDKNSVFESEADAYTSFVAKVKGEYTARVRRALKAKLVKRKLTQCEFDALVDLAYQKGNCNSLAQRIADNKPPLTKSDFVSQTAETYANRRSAEYNLFSGTQVTVKGYSKFLRHDNTNGGYCPINGKQGWTKVNSKTNIVLTY